MILKIIYILCCYYDEVVTKYVYKHKTLWTVHPTAQCYLNALFHQYQTESLVLNMNFP